ncbi:MAG: hypothetical protein IPM66_22045 [Acidobacteriota bacterium]|nr:MAG: hypothetical protein IPM66_22045 [Acidobacteriota bacterium]
MTTITLEVPDELAAQLDSWREQLPQILSRLLTAMPAAKTSAWHKSGSALPVYQELVDFLATGPTPEQILAFRISAAAQERLSDLLYRNREEELTEAESAELDMYELVHHAVILLKARAHLTDSESNHPSPVK